MEKTKKISLGMFVCLVIIVLLLITIFGMWFYYSKKDKKTIRTIKNIEQFKKYIETKGFNVYDAKEKLQDSTFKDSIKNGYITYKNDNNDFRINYFEIIDENNTFYYYYKEILAIEQDNMGEFNETNYKEDNYNKYTALTNGKYIVLIRLDNVVVYGAVLADNKNDLDLIINDLILTK